MDGSADGRRMVEMVKWVAGSGPSLALAGWKWLTDGHKVEMITKLGRQRVSNVRQVVESWKVVE